MVVFADSRHAVRSVHAKSHGILKGELEVLPGLPAELAQGLFAKPAQYPVIMRLSTIAGDLLEDSVSLPRGIAIKVVGVDGERLPGSEDSRTQDFLLVDGPVFTAPNARRFLASLKLLAKTTDKAPELKKALSYVLRGVEAGVESVGGESAMLKRWAVIRTPIFSVRAAFPRYRSVMAIISPRWRCIRSLRSWRL